VPVVIQTLAQQQAARLEHDLNEIDKTAKYSPFKTGAQVLAHDKDPLDVAGIFTTMAANETVTVKEEPAKVAREELEKTAERLLDLMPKGTQLIVSDQMRDHPSWKVKDVFYYGIEALANQKAGRK